MTSTKKLEKELKLMRDNETFYKNALCQTQNDKDNADYYKRQAESIEKQIKKLKANEKQN